MIQPDGGEHCCCVAVPVYAGDPFVSALGGATDGSHGRFAKAVAGGQLQQRLSDPLDDELGQLSTALSSMAQRTSDIVGEMLEASRALATAASELLDSSTQQAQNANQQATSITQMGATVAELRQTFGEATSKAESVIELARRSEESSTGGGSAVKEKHDDGMGHLRDQVQAISPETIQGCWNEPIKSTRSSKW